LLFVNACATGPQIIKETSAKARPGWIEHPPQESGVVYFVGISTATKTLEDGRGVALNNALTKVAGFLGSKIKTVFEGHFTEIEQTLSQRIRSKSAAKVHGAHVVETYHEKTITKTKDEVKESFDVYVLVSFSKEEALKEMARQKKEKEETVKRAYEYFNKGQELEGEAKFYAAGKEYRQAKKILDPIDELITVEAGNNEELMLKLKTRIKDMDQRLKRLKLSFKVNGTPDEEKMFRSNFSSAIDRNGFNVNDDQPAFEITGEVSVFESSYVMNSYAYYAEGSLTATRTADNQIIAVYPFKVKGFHRSKDKAAMVALKEAGLETGDKLSQLISRKQRAEAADHQ
jgi:hypothetical protein